MTLGSLLSEVFDSCIISPNSVVLRFNDLQIAYIKRCTTIQCVFMVTDVINYYRNNGSSVYMCMLDASNAIDRVPSRCKYESYVFPRTQSAGISARIHKAGLDERSCPL